MLTKITAKAIPDHAEAKQVLLFAARSVGAPHDGLMIKIKNSKRPCIHGRCFGAVVHNDADWKAGARFLITILLPEQIQYPHDDKFGKHPLVLADWKEALIVIAAHELWHHVECIKWYEAKRRNLFIRHPHSETQANWNSWKTLNEWREHK